MLQLAKSHMGVKEDERLKLYCEDGLQFMQQAAPCTYDVVIVDVAAPNLVRHMDTVSTVYIPTVSIDAAVLVLTSSCHPHEVRTDCCLIQEVNEAGTPGQVLAPVPEFLSRSFFSRDVALDKLKHEGLMAVNVIGDESHTEAVHASLSGCVNIAGSMAANGLRSTLQPVAYVF